MSDFVFPPGNGNLRLNVATSYLKQMRDHYRMASRVIDRLMPPRLRTGYDAEDFVGDAIVELMTNAALADVESPALLIHIAKCRMVDAARSPRSRVLPLEVDAVDPQPAVDLECEASEQLEILLGRAGGPRCRAVVDLRSQGYSLPEIAELTGVGLRTLQRFYKSFTEANRPY